MIDYIVVYLREKLVWRVPSGKDKSRSTLNNWKLITCGNAQYVGIPGSIRGICPTKGPCRNVAHNTEFCLTCQWTDAVDWKSHLLSGRFVMLDNFLDGRRQIPRLVYSQRFMHVHANNRL